jgi:hypothetical protein
MEESTRDTSFDREVSIEEFVSKEADASGICSVLFF